MLMVLIYFSAKTYNTYYTFKYMACLLLKTTHLETHHPLMVLFPELTPSYTLASDLFQSRHEWLDIVFVSNTEGIV